MKSNRSYIVLPPLLVVVIALLTYTAVGQVGPTASSKAEAIIAKAVRSLGGDPYLRVRSQVGRGKFSLIKDGVVVSFQTFTDAIVYPDTERTEFKSGASRTVQVNRSDTGWIYDGDQDLIKVQSAVQIENFRRGLRTSLDNLLRGYWKGSAELSYVGRRPGALGTRNDVVRLAYKDGLAVEFEFADDGTPQKAVYKSKEGDGEPVTEEDRYAQFIDIGGIKAPFIVDRFTGGAHSSRINYESIEVNKNLPDAIFTKPSSAKDAKKTVKF
jgi:lipopolysaccharide export LptBFGC system permease protein LptF